jgi:hypothetical protein
MMESSEIRYDVLIDRVIGQLKPVKRLWPVSARLAVWMLLELGLLVAAVLLKRRPDLVEGLRDPQYLLELAIFASIGIIAAGLALRTAVPGRQVTSREVILIALAGLAGFLLMAREPMETGISLTQFLSAGSISSLYMIALAAGPWLALFWAVRRGVPLYPQAAGGLIGVAAFSCALVASRMISPLDDPLYLLTWQLMPAALAVVLSALIAANWLDPQRIWAEAAQSKGETVAAANPARADGRSLRSLASPGRSSLIAMGEQVSFGVALAAAVVLVVSFMRGQSQMTTLVPDFDLAIASYDRALTKFKPNVPSDSPAVLMKAYIEHGMPAYMWDFGRDGYRIAGGRFDPKPDGTPVTFTLYRGKRSDIMCMFRGIEGFNPPASAYQERRGYFFYSYRGYSICLNNIGGYGNFACVLVTQLRLSVFMRQVLAVAP